MTRVSGLCWLSLHLSILAVVVTVAVAHGSRKTEQPTVVFRAKIPGNQSHQIAVTGVLLPRPGSDSRVFCIFSEDSAGSSGTNGGHDELTIAQSCDFTSAP